MKTIPEPRNAALVLREIQASAENLTTAKQARIRLIRLGRAEGITYRDIGKHLGISASGVIDILKRAGEDL